MRKWTPEKLKARRRQRRSAKRWKGMMVALESRYWNEGWWNVYAMFDAYVIAVLTTGTDTAKRDAIVQARAERTRQRLAALLAIASGVPVETSDQAATGKPALQVGGVS